MADELDSLDIRLLQLLQHDARPTNKELADKVGMSVTAVYERIHRMEERGLIKRYVALVDREAIGKSLLAFAIVKVKEHSKSALRGFEREVIKFAEVMECYQLTGQFDFLLKVAIRDMKEYNAFLMDKLATLPNIASVETMFVVSEGKVETAYHLELPVTKKPAKKRNRGRTFLLLIGVIIHLCTACSNPGHLQIRKSATASMPGTEFYKTVAAWHWRERDSLAVQLILSGDIPAFLKKFVRIETSITDSATGERMTAAYYVAPDYLSLGPDDDWVRIPLTPMAAQKIADSFDCFLPTRKMVNDIYLQARVKLEPVPMYAFRDSSVTMWQHHLIIEGQRKGRKGLIAGIKKDVVISANVAKDARPDRVAIYGWHRLTGVPIQPLYTGHVNWYVDYSHGIRLVYRKIWVNGKPMDYTDVLKSPPLRKLLCDEVGCDFYRYVY